MNTLLIDTTPKNARNQGSINLGYEVVSKKLNAERCHFSDSISGSYDQLAFNIYYPTHIFNMLNFMHRNNIKSVKNGGNCHIVAGGQGVGVNGILNNIVDEVYIGEIDYESNKESITSAPVVKGRKGVVELTRGCRNKCKFCEYSHLWAKTYREKDIVLAKKQIAYLANKGIKFINFLSANFAGYSEIQELVLYAKSKAITILNSDSCLKDIGNIMPIIQYLPKYMKFGVESFTQSVRYGVAKPISDDFLFTTIETLMDKINGLHLYMIYGLPNENYDNWAGAIAKIDKMRKHHTTDIPTLFGTKKRYNTKKIRVEFSITNFEPCVGTPLENSPTVDFREKDEFLELWKSALTDHGFLRSKNFDYKTARGRIGRKKLSYDLLMMLKKSGAEMTETLQRYKKPVGRSIQDNEVENILEMN